MTGYESKRAAAQDKLKCQCSLSTSLTGDGCQYCNPEYMDDDALTIAYQSGYYDGKKAAQPAQEPDLDFYTDAVAVLTEEGWIWDGDQWQRPPQPAQEPVAYLCGPDENGLFGLPTEDKACKDCFPVYTAPPQRTWVEPTEGEWFKCWLILQAVDETEAEFDFADFLIIAQAVVANLKEKNT